MGIAWNGRRIGLVSQFALVAVLGLWFQSRACAQLILNEAKTSDEDKFLEVAFNDVQILNPYEGYDFGVVPYSFNTNPVDGPNPGNPYPDDLDTGTPGNQLTLPNGWHGTTGWGRVLGNGGDWFEMVVTEDHTDLRGYTLYWENNQNPGGVGENPANRGVVKFTQDKAWANLRAGTIVTLSEDATVDEIRDKYPTDLPADQAGPAPHDTGYNYDVHTDLSFNPFTAGDWHVHFQVDEDITKGDTENAIPPAATQYFEANSDVTGHNRDWEMKIFNATNTALAAQVETSAPRASLDLTTGAVQGFVGEKAPGWGSNVPGVGGVNGNEMVALRGSPGTNLTAANYEDMDWSSFGAPNVFNLYQPGNPNLQDDSKLGGVQDFSALRNPVLANTYNWTATGTANFGTAGNWQNAQSDTAPGAGPQAMWTAQLTNATGGAKMAQVTTNTTVSFASVAAQSGSMTLDVQSGATLAVQNGPIEPGRVHVLHGGALKVGGGVTAAKVEVFAGGKIFGGGTITGNLANSGGAVAPGASTATLTVTGNYIQTAGAAALPGDYSGNGVVDAADYTVWRDNLGPGSLDNEGDGISPDQVDSADYDFWKAHFGDSLSPSGLLIELAGTGAGQFDLLSVAGTANLQGTLDVSLLGGFAPSAGTMFTVLTASSVSSSLTLSGDHAAEFQLLVNPTSLVLKYVGAGAAGIATVPEPSSLMVAALAATLGLAIGRQRTWNRR